MSNLLVFVLIRLFFLIGIFVGFFMLLKGYFDSSKKLSYIGKIIGFTSLLVSIALTAHSLISRIGV